MRISMEFKDYAYERYIQKVKFYLIVFFTLTCVLFLFLICCRAEDYSKFTDEQIVWAIGKAENSVKYPYGVKSIETRGNIEYAKRICLNSVRNGRARWIKANKPCDLVDFISRRYCPVNAPDDNGTNKFWARNVKFFLDKL